MSDNGNQEPDYAMEVMREVVEESRRDKMTTDELRSHMMMLYGQAEEQGDDDRQQVINSAWGIIQTLDKKYGDAMSLVDKTVSAANLLLGQRNIAILRHDELITALDTLDGSHPAVEKAMGEISDLELEAIHESGSYISHCPGCDITETGMVPVTHEVAEVFHQILMGETMSETPSELLDELAEFMMGFIQRVNGAPGEGESHVEAVGE